MPKPKHPKKSRRTYRRPFAPAPPAISAGKFKGRSIDSLSDEELNYFIKHDARFQVSDAQVPTLFPGLPALPPQCVDFAPYWCAKFELERRKKEDSPSIQFRISSTDTLSSVAKRLVHVAYRLASKQFHPDHGGDNNLMVRITEARDRLLDAAKKL